MQETLYARTDDGWNLALHRYAPREIKFKHPVLMVHGLGANRLHFDLDERYSLARAARARGFDVYVLELRGAGASTAPQGLQRSQLQWGFSDYAERDLPTAISAVLERTGAQALHGIGHSMGGMLFYSVATGAPSELRSVVAIGAPFIGHLHLGSRERRLLYMANSLSPAANVTPGQRRVPLKKLLGAAGLFLPLGARFGDGILLNLANCEPDVVTRMIRDAIDDVPLRLITEIVTHSAGAGDTVGPYMYETRLHDIRSPLLALGGAVDRVATPASVAAAVTRLTGPDLRYREMGVRHGDRADYGHVDLLVGRHAPEEVYPQLIDFLEEVD